MKFYRFDKYIINNGISLRKNYIYDKRIDELIKLDNEDFYIIKCIFKNTKISEILKNENIDIDMLKVWLEYLYNNDILILNRCFYKKTIYMSNYKYMFFKAITIFIIRFLLSIILINLIIKIPMANIIQYTGVFIISFIFHELGHFVSFYLFNKNEFKVYINIDKIKFEIVTSKKNCRHIRIVSLMGPLMGGIISIFLYLLIKRSYILLIAFFHIVLILPIFQDGKNIWKKYY